MTKRYALSFNVVGLILGDASANDFRELFDVLHLAPYYNLGNARPDYLVVCLIPGNKVSPSTYTPYNT